MYRDYDDYNERTNRSRTAVVSMIGIVLIMIGCVSYLILSPEETDQVKTENIEEAWLIQEEQASESIGVESNEEVQTVDYRKLWIDAEQRLSALQQKTLDNNQKVVEYNKQRDDKELEDLRTIQKLTEERDAYKAAYEELETFASALMEELKEL